jgi:quercetin dioxygenase-like cupin family protein
VAVRVFHRDESDARLPMIAEDARLVVWPGVGAYTANMNYTRMLPDEANAPHVHAESEDTIFVLSGEATVRDLTNDEAHVVRAGQVVHIPAGLEHQVVGDRGVVVESVGGPCPADLHALRAAGLLDEGPG